MTNIRDIAREAKVSVATVSRLLDPEKRKLVHPDTREAIEKIIRKHRYTPNRTAQALSRQSTNTVGMVTPFSADVVKSPYFEGLIAGIIEGIGPLSYDLKWIMIRDSERESCSLQALLQKHSVDGLIFLAWRLIPHLVDEVQKHAHLPAVLINDHDAKVSCSIVYSHNESGVVQICDHFISKGYKKIGMLRGPDHISHDAYQRYLTFKNCVREPGMTFKPEWAHSCPRFDESSGYETMRAWIQKGKLPQAIFCANDDIAIGAIRALKEKRIKVPGDVAIAGYDDSERNNNVVPPLTTMRQPLEAMGKAAIETLDKLITKGVKGPVRLKFEPELIVRESA